MEKKNLLTYEGLKRLEDELQDLKVVKRKEVAQKIKEAREQGDLSENAEYDAAKDEQRDIEARIEELEKILKNAEVVVEDEVDLDKIKMPKAVSRSKAKNGVISYDVDSLANRFGVLFPDLKEAVKQNIADYGEFLPETFFKETGTPRVLDVIKNGNEAERKKLFKMLNEVYEDGTNEVQDIIGVTILGEMKNDPAMMEVADRYMTDYLSAPVHEINKITAKKNRFTRKLAHPPAYKPKKKKSNILQNALTQQPK